MSDPRKINAINDRTVPVDVIGVCKFLGIADYLHYYSRSYGEMTVHLSCLLKKYVKRSFNDDGRRYFEGIKQSLMQSLILVILEQDRPYQVVCDASVF